MASDQERGTVDIHRTVYYHAWHKAAEISTHCTACQREELAAALAAAEARGRREGQQWAIDAVLTALVRHLSEQITKENT